MERKSSRELYAGIEAGGTKWVIGLGSGPDHLDALTRIPTTTPTETLASTVTAIRSGLRDRRLDGVGIASFGPLRLDPAAPDAGHILRTPKRGWSGTNLVGALAAAFDAPIRLDTDVNGAALAEALWGAARDVSSLVYLTVGTGIGGGAIVNGGPVHGALHPEMGHLLPRRHPDDPFAGLCPFHGDCVEGLASGPAMTARWGHPAEELDGADRRAALAIEASYLAQLITAVTLVVSPHRVVLGGGVSQLDGLLPAVRAALVALLGDYPASPALAAELGDYVVPPRLGDRAGVLGAIAIAADARASQRRTPAGRT